MLREVQIKTIDKQAKVYAIDILITHLFNHHYIWIWVLLHKCENLHDLGEDLTCIVLIATPLIILGYVDIQTSFPLSRFVGNQTSVQLDFAVGGANAITWVIVQNAG